MRRWTPVAALVAAISSTSPAASQQVMSTADFLRPLPPRFSLPRPTDSGKPVIYDPQFVAKGEADRNSSCSPGLQCRVQVLGVIQNNGAVELRTTAFTW
jgi:hypothetical protein